MSKSSSLRTSDIHSLYQLVGECRELGDDAHVWWGHLMQQSACMVDADLSIGGLITTGLMGPENLFGEVKYAYSCSWGWAENDISTAGVEWAMTEARTNPRYDASINAYWIRTRQEPGLALTRPHLIRDRDWYNSVAYRNSIEPCGLDARLQCFNHLPDQRDEFGGLFLARKTRRRDFNPRECAIIQGLVAALSPLIGRALAGLDEPSPSGLAPRVRQVLRCILEGEGDKQIAARLGMSPHTVNVYTKTIYPHFGVQSRSELLARWVRRGWGARFAWAD